MLERIKDDDDPLVRALAAVTPVEKFGQWLARDRRPTRGIIGDRTVAIGDAAHPMLPCIGQGACTSIEDGIVSTRVATAHIACTTRQPNPISSLVASTPLGIPFAKGAGGWMRLLNRANGRVLRGIASAEARQSEHR
jgi:hypothetical protein